MKVLLVGGSGIISSEICCRLLNQGHEVTILNRGRRRSMIDSRAKLVIADMRNESMVQIEAKLEIKYDVVVDFIAYDVSQLKKSLVLFQYKCRQYIFISSATAYSEGATPPYEENSQIGGNSWEYSRKKAECEKYLQDNEKTLPCEYTIIRPYITYGKTRIPYQFCPTEYYTLLNRIINEKPIPITEGTIRCTLTNATEFAIGAVGLMINPIAYAEVFHITCSYDMTWEEVIQIIGEKLNKHITLVRIPLRYLQEHRDDAGFDVDEILGDKGRCMVFNNEKIRLAVPEFKGNIIFCNGISESIEYYMSHPEIQSVNYRWDAAIDRMISDCTQDLSIKKKLRMSGYKETLSGKNKRLYFINRYWIMIKMKKIIKKKVCNSAML